MQFWGYRIFEGNNFLVKEGSQRNLPMIGDMGGESCSFGGGEWSMDLMVVQRRLGFLEASLMRSRLDAANDEVINLFADEQAAR